MEGQPASLGAQSAPRKQTCPSVFLEVWRQLPCLAQVTERDREQEEGEGERAMGEEGEGRMSDIHADQ